MLSAWSSTTRMRALSTRGATASGADPSGHIVHPRAGRRQLVGGTLRKGRFQAGEETLGVHSRHDAQVARIVGEQRKEILPVNDDHGPRFQSLHDRLRIAF